MLLVWSFGIVGAAKPASAQVNYQFNYQFLRVTNEPGTNYPLGFDVNAGFPLKAMGPLHAIGDLSWGRHSQSEAGLDVSATEFTLGVGLRWKPIKVTRLGIQALVGIARDGIKVADFDIDESESNLFIQPGVQFNALSINDSWDIVVGGNLRLVLSEGESGKVITFTVGLASK